MPHEMNYRVVLIVEDNPHLGRLYANILAHQGFTVIQAIDERHAIQWLARLTPDLVMLDLGMRMGIQVLEWIEERPGQFKDTRVVAVTDKIDSSMRHKFAFVLERPVSSHALRGMAEHLTRPFSYRRYCA
ncbi:MAG TPA: response regulator [Aggregatilineales bacterium]|nr:response regulator [Aggregatilineales bacterium]